MKCSFCGYEVEGNAKYCPNCGTKLEQPQEQVPEQTENPADSYSYDGASDNYSYGDSSDGYSYGNPADDNAGTAIPGSGQGSAPSGGGYSYGAPGAGYGADAPNTGQSAGGAGYGAGGYGAGYGAGGYGTGGHGPVISSTPYLIFSIFVTICCCIPLGVVGIVYAAKIGSLQQVGDYEGAARAARKARNFSIVGVILGLIIGIGTAALSTTGLVNEVIQDPDFMQEIQELQNQYPEQEEDEAITQEDNTANEQAQDATDQSQEETAQTQETKPAKTKADANSWNAFTVTIGGEKICFPCTISDVEASGLKLNDATVTGDSELAAGANQFVVFGDDSHSILFLMVNNSDKAKKLSDCTVNGIYLSDYDIEDGTLSIVFPGNVEIGSERDDVIKAWGQTEDIYEGQSVDIYTWSEAETYNNCTVTFDKTSMKVTGIDMDRSVE